MRYFLSLFLILLNLLALKAQETTPFEEGKEHYKNGAYDRAAAQWETIVESGYESAAVYYNLGNAYYKQDRLGPAIFYYEKALMMTPGDRDIQNNLSLARERTIDAIEPLPQSGFSKGLNDFRTRFSPDGWAWVSVLFAALFVGLFLWYYLTTGSMRKRILFSSAFASLLICLLGLALAYSARSAIDNNRFAILFAGQATLYEAPSVGSGVAFTLHEGSKMRITDQEGDWYRIELTDGKNAWIHRESVREL